ncbi:hypothetical protein E4U55_006942 [Claviceps digitariae]|nr:hypothetical protein E4U55_006942 [Claviceps digitariae]
MSLPSGNVSSANSSSVLDFSGNFASWSSSRDWRRRVLTPYSNSKVNYTIVAAWADVNWVRWVASRDVWFSGSNEATIDSLAVGDGEGGARREGIEGSEKQWLSRGHDDATGRHFITIHIQSWLDSMGRNDGVGEDGSYSPRPGDYMKLKMEWTRQDGPSRKGVSSSGLFTVAESADAAEVKQKWNHDIVQNFDEGQVNGYEEAAPTATETGLPFDSGVATSTGSSAPTPPPPSIDTGPVQGADIQGGDSSSSSISPGAIAGIATGCGIALILLITALMWYLVSGRHRRRHHHQHPAQHGYDAHDKATALTDDDNRNSTAHAARLPEDNPVRDDSSRHILVNTHTHIYTEADDNTDVDGPMMRHQQAEREASPRAVAVAPATNFAERGMTVEERRRWEEEERQLDDEIARKNRGVLR